MAKQVALVNAAIPYPERRSTRLLEEATDSKMAWYLKNKLMLLLSSRSQLLKHSDRADASCPTPA
jgi:hypothetical protein